jgi:hypothetical protein
LRLAGTRIPAREEAVAQAFGDPRSEASCAVLMRHSLRGYYEVTEPSDRMGIRPPGS